MTELPRGIHIRRPPGWVPAAAQPTEDPEATGIVESWHRDEGWGVLVSPDVAGTVFAHFSAIDAPGYRELQPGKGVRFRYVPYGHDGCEHRATYVATVD